MGAVLVDDGLICDGISWWSGFNKVFDAIDGVGIGIGKIMERMVTNNHVSPSDGAPIGSLIIVVDGGRIP